MIVDRMAPGVDGLWLVSPPHRRDLDMPGLFLSAMGTIGDRLRGPDAGSDITQ